MSSDKVTVEIFTAGDGINYPKKGQTVTIHYTGYARRIVERRFAALHIANAANVLPNY